MSLEFTLAPPLFSEEVAHSLLGCGGIVYDTQTQPLINLKNIQIASTFTYTILHTHTHKHTINWNFISQTLFDCFSLIGFVVVAANTFKQR